jgi:ATP-dependent RNA helicase RhlE
MTFENLEIIEPLMRALNHEGYSTPTPIQQQAIPVILNNHDILGCAQTGTGKTAAFSIPILQNIYKSEKNGKKRVLKALILAPTRELALQISESFAAYGRYTDIKHTVIFGGVGQRPQTDALRKGVEILVATPGRLLDLMGQGYVDLRNIEFFVLDEADRMLDMGFIHDIQRIVSKLPQKRQTLLFSATMPDEIAHLAQSILRDPVRVDVTPPSSTVDTIEQYLYYADREHKMPLLVDLLRDESKESVLIFSRTKHGADKIAKNLLREGIRSDAIHGNKSQTARQIALKKFKSKKIRVLIATDIASRGIDINSLSHVINYDLPEDPESYVHRIGRTGRAGMSGIALSFCDTKERTLLKSIQKLIGKKLDIIEHELAISEPVQQKDRRRRRR